MKLGFWLMFLIATVAGRAEETTLDAARRIDAALVRGYESVAARAALPPLPEAADDATFLRRACIDLAGRLPHPEEVQAYLAEPSPRKRLHLIDRLVAEPGAAEVRFHGLAEALRVTDEVGGRSEASYISWLRKAARDDMPYDQLVKTLLTADANESAVGGLIRRDGANSLRTAAEVARTFLGQDLYCAMCHDHPYNDRQQRESYEFAAWFHEAETLRLPKHYLYQNGRPGEAVVARVLMLPGTSLAERNAPASTPDGKAKRAQLVSWMTDPATTEFAAVAALRIWRGLFGLPASVGRTIGGVDPAMPWHGVKNGVWAPAVHFSARACFAEPSRPFGDFLGTDFSNHLKGHPVLQVLADEFRRCGYRTAIFQRILASTAAYQRAAVAPERAGAMYYPAPHIRRLPAETVWDTLAGKLKGRNRDIQLSEGSAQVPQVSHPLRILGRGTREWTDESTTPVSHELVRFMMNSEVVAEAAVSADVRDVETIFLEILGRFPTPREQETVDAVLEASPDTAHQHITWALLNTREFMFRR